MAIEYTVNIKDILKLTEGHWPKWAREVRSAFREAGLLGYIDGTLDEPTDARKLAEWNSYNSRIIGTLGRIVDDALMQDIEALLNARQAWLLLERRTNQGGIGAKLNAIRNALTMKFSFTTPTTSTIATIKDLLSTIYENGVAPTREELGAIVLLNALDGSDYDWVQKNLLTQFSNPKTIPTERDIIETINFAGSDKHNVTNGVNVAKSNKPGSSKTNIRCTNCQSRKHIFENCWAKGGGAEGKGPDWWKALQEKKLKAKVALEEKANIASLFWNP